VCGWGDVTEELAPCSHSLQHIAFEDCEPVSQGRPIASGEPAPEHGRLAGQDDPVPAERGRPVPVPGQGRGPSWSLAGDRLSRVRRSSSSVWSSRTVLVALARTPTSPGRPTGWDLDRAGGAAVLRPRHPAAAAGSGQRADPRPGAPAARGPSGRPPPRSSNQPVTVQRRAASTGVSDPGLSAAGQPRRGPRGSDRHSRGVRDHLTIELGDRGPDRAADHDAADAEPEGLPARAANRLAGNATGLRWPAVDRGSTRPLLF